MSYILTYGIQTKELLCLRHSVILKLTSSCLFCIPNCESTTLFLLNWDTPFLSYFSNLTPNGSQNLHYTSLTDLCLITLLWSIQTRLLYVVKLVNGQSEKGNKVD